MSDDLVCRRSEPEVVTRSCVHSPGQPSLHTEQTLILPDSCEMLPQVCDVYVVSTFLSSLCISSLLVHFFSQLGES